MRQLGLGSELCLSIAAGSQSEPNRLSNSIPSSRARHVAVEKTRRQAHPYPQLAAPAGREPLLSRGRPRLRLFARRLERARPPGELVQHVLGVLLEHVELGELLALFH